MLSINIPNEGVNWLEGQVTARYGIAIGVDAILVKIQGFEKQIPGKYSRNPCPTIAPLENSLH